MTDPITVIALAAAVGGAAGKLAEKTWDVGETWLRERFGTHQAEAQERARANAAEFIQQLASHLSAFERQRLVSERQISSQESQPQFTRLLERSLLNAAETEDTAKHDLLGRLVANRLAVASETTVALASQLASDTITRSTRNQLHLLALTCFIHEIRPRDPVDSRGFLQWLDVFLKPFDELEFKDIDARHLVAIAAVSYEPSKERDLDLLLKLKGTEQNWETDIGQLSRVAALQYNWDSGLAGVSLTSVGSVVGGLALDQLLGKQSVPPKWD